jgi:hypothetical protein
MNQRRATILAVASLGLLWGFLAIFTLPMIAVLVSLLPTCAILYALTLRGLHDSLRRQRELLEEAKRTREQ